MWPEQLLGVTFGNFPNLKNKGNNRTCLTSSLWGFSELTHAQLQLCLYIKHPVYSHCGSPRTSPIEAPLEWKNSHQLSSISGKALKKLTQNLISHLSSQHLNPLPLTTHMVRTLILRKNKKLQLTLPSNQTTTPISFSFLLVFTVNFLNIFSVATVLTWLRFALENPAGITLGKSELDFVSLPRAV